MDLVLRRAKNGWNTEIVWPDGGTTDGAAYWWAKEMGCPPLRSGQKLVFRLVRTRTKRA